MSVRPWRWSRLLAVIVLVGVIAGVPAIRGSVLRAAGLALVVDEPIGPADVIVIPLWAGAGGAIEAADLVHSGIAARVAVLPEPPRPAERELTRRGITYMSPTADLVQLLHLLGVTNVDVIPDPAAGTEIEGQVLRAWCDRQGVRSIVVVSAKDHSRRVRRVLRRAFSGAPASVLVRSARYSTFDPNAWWQSRDGVRVEIVELQKLLLDIARHPFS